MEIEKLLSSILNPVAESPTLKEQSMMVQNQINIINCSGTAVSNIFINNNGGGEMLIQ